MCRPLDDASADDPVDGGPVTGLVLRFRLQRPLRREGKDLVIRVGQQQGPGVEPGLDAVPGRHEERVGRQESRAARERVFGLLVGITAQFRFSARAGPEVIDGIHGNPEDGFPGLGQHLFPDAFPEGKPNEEKAQDSEQEHGQDHQQRDHAPGDRLLHAERARFGREGAVAADFELQFLLPPLEGDDVPVGQEVDQFHPAAVDICRDEAGDGNQHPLRFAVPADDGVFLFRERPAGRKAELAVGRLPDADRVGRSGDALVGPDPVPRVQLGKYEVGAIHGNGH